MSLNIHQIYTNNPITSNASTDLMYFGQSPYGSADNAAMTFANFSAQFLLPANNLSDVANAGTSRTNLGLAIGTNVQAYSAALSSVAGLTTIANNMIYTTASNTYAVIAPVDSAALLTNGAGAPGWVAYTGTGSPVLSNTPTLVTPALGAATATSINFGGSTLSTYVASSSWTPAVSFATPGDVSISYSTQSGKYSRIGNIISVHFKLSFTPTFTTASGNMQISGLPVALSFGATGSCQFQASTFPVGTTSIFLQAVNSASYFVVGINGTTTATAYMTTTQIVSGGPINMQGSITYLA